jgi:hypothetical protein
MDSIPEEELVVAMSEASSALAVDEVWSFIFCSVFLKFRKCSAG